MNGARMQGGDRSGVEQAKAHGAVRRRMVSGRAGQNKSIRRLARKDRIDGPDSAACRAKRGLKRMRSDYGVVVKPQKSFARRCSDHGLNIGFGVNPRQSFPRGDTWRFTDEAAKCFSGERPRCSFIAFGALGMAGRRFMGGEGAMFNQYCRH